MLKSQQVGTNWLSSLIQCCICFNMNFRQWVCFKSSFDDRDSALALVKQVTSEPFSTNLGDRLADELLSWREEVTPMMRRLRKQKCQRMGRVELKPGTRFFRAAWEFEEIVRNDPFHALEVAKRKCKQLKKLDHYVTRAEKEQAALTKCSCELSVIV